MARQRTRRHTSTLSLESDCPQGRVFRREAVAGTVLAFMMSVIALSLPEAIILRKVLKPQLIAVFFGIVALGIMLVGFLFNALM